MASVQEKNLSQVSREKSEKKPFILTFHQNHVYEVVKEFVKNSVAFGLDYPENPYYCRVAFYPDSVPPTFIHDLWYDFDFDFNLTAF